MERQKRIIKASIFGIVMNIFLVIFKATVGLMVNSIAIVIDAVNNLTDVVSAIVTIVGTKLAGKKPDKRHPYGHGRIEYVASVIVSFIVLLAGVIALKESVEKILNPGETNYSLVSMIIIAVAVFVKYFFSKYAKKVGRELNSQSLIATGEDAYMDSLLSFSTLVAAIVNYMWNMKLEGYLGVIISFVIFKSAIDMLKETINIMIGERADKELTDKLKKKICSNKEVQGAYDLSIHNYGPSKSIATLNIQVRDDMTAKEIHALTKQLAIDIYNELGIITTIGIYAANDTGEYVGIKSSLTRLVKKYKDIKQVHGFYVDEKKKNIYFDLIFEFECENSEEIKNDIIKKLEEKYSDYKFIVIVDDDISD